MLLVLYDIQIYSWELFNEINMVDIWLDNPEAISRAGKVCGDHMRDQIVLDDDLWKDMLHLQVIIKIPLK